MKTLKKSLAIVLSLIMLISALPMVSVSAETAYKVLKLDTIQTVELSGESVILRFIPESDGYYEFYSTGEYDTYADLVFSNTDYSVYDDDSGDELNFSIKEKLYAGDVYYLVVNTYEEDGMSLRVNISVRETVGVESMEITQYPYDMTCIKGFEYQTADLSGLEIDFKLSDGKVVSYRYDEGKNIVEGFRIGFSFATDDSGECYYEIVCGKAVETLDYTAVESPVESIEYSCETEIELYYHTHGYLNQNDDFIYFYTTPKDAVININYKDGTTAQAKIYDEIDGYYVELQDNQYDAPWDIGTNYFTLSYLGVETQVSVEVLETPIKSVTVNSAPSREYFFGDEEWGYLNEVSRYEFYPSDLTGLSFTVTYLDGTTETFSDIDMKNETIGGKYYDVDICYAVRPCTVSAKLTFMGFEFNYDVAVVESPIKDLELIFGPDNCFYEERYYPVFDGTKLRLTFTDGSRKEITLSDENTYYGDDGYLEYVVNAGDVDIHIYQSYEGEVSYNFSCVDKWVHYDGIYFEENREISDIKVDNFTPDGDGTIITVSYADGSSDKLIFDTLSYHDYKYGGAGFAKTENGILDYEITEVVKNGEVVSYKLHIFDEIITVDNVKFEIGDVDSDGVVSIMDATAIAFHMAQIKTLSSKRLEFADVDKDGVVSIMDATAIQMHIAQII